MLAVRLPPSSVPRLHAVRRSSQQYCIDIDGYVEESWLFDDARLDSIDHRRDRRSDLLR